MSGKPRLTYFNGRGRMEPVRWLLAAAGVEVSWNLEQCSRLVFPMGPIKEQFNTGMEDKGCKRVAKFTWLVALHVCTHLVQWLIFGMKTQ